MRRVGILAIQELGIETGRDTRPGGRIVEITDRDRSRMNNKLIQLWRFVVLNFMILKAVTHSKLA